MTLLIHQFGAISLGIMAIALPACSSNEEVENGGSTNVTTEEVARDPQALDNQLVTIRSKVKKTVGDSAFVVDDKTLGGDNILVVNTTGKPFILPQDDDVEVQVTGEVAPFNVADANREFNLVLEPQIFAEYENQPALMAESLALAPNPGEVTDNPANFYNKEIAIEGKVDEITSPNTFIMNDPNLFGGEDLMVLNLSPQAITEAGDTVTIIGVLRPFVKADFDKDYDLKWDLSVQEKLEVEYTNKPVFIADEIYPRAQ